LDILTEARTAMVSTSGFIDFRLHKQMQCEPRQTLLQITV